MPNAEDSNRPSGRVQELLVGRRAGTVSLKQFKAQLEVFSTEELADLASALLEASPGPRRRLKRDLLNQLGHASKPA